MSECVQCGAGGVDEEDALDGAGECVWCATGGYGPLTRPEFARMMRRVCP